MHKMIARSVTEGSNTHIVSRSALFSRRTRGANFTLKWRRGLGTTAT